ncbi:hypothetical protein sos41_31160 [Alphaproteobacteria bacterium SO-S41]|nr:hypothetical protein sos41_31160 [Alphaproteobacteria bacterium SO-S41]
MVIEVDPNYSGLAGLPYKVVRIEAGVPGNPRALQHGTGFFFAMDVLGRELPIIISNKHVLSGASYLSFEMARQKNNRREFAPPEVVRFRGGALPVFEHPDPEVDLAAVPLAPIWNEMQKRGVEPFPLVEFIGSLPPPYIEQAIHAATPALMVGFPQGLLDEVNNLPLVRRGIFATPYSANYMGKEEFVVDIAAFPGSSGSPVYAVFEGVLPTEWGFTHLNHPVAFLAGILWGGPQFAAEGKMIPMAVPQMGPITAIPAHLGYCIKARRILELKPLIVRHIQQHAIDQIPPATS